MYPVPRPHKQLLEILSRVIKIAWLLVHPTPLFYCLFNCRKFVLTIKLAAVISLMSTSWTHEQIEQQSCRAEAPIHSKFGSNIFSYGTHLTGQIFRLSRLFYQRALCPVPVQGTNTNKRKIAAIFPPSATIMSREAAAIRYLVGLFISLSTA